jgi:hypothetical protein
MGDGECVPPAARSLPTYARAERNGVVVCPEALLVVQGRPGGLGTQARDDLTVWFYGALTPQLEVDLEGLADAARGGLEASEVLVDLVLQTAGGPMRLDGCVIGMPIRHAGPPSTLEYRLAHAGAPAAVPVAA